MSIIIILKRSDDGDYNTSTPCHLSRNSVIIILVLTNKQTNIHGNLIQSINKQINKQTSKQTNK